MKQTLKDLWEIVKILAIPAIVIGLIIFQGYLFFAADCKTVVKFYSIAQTPARCLITK